ncbi:MAG: acyltransferase [Chloroflexota bacterium]|nr:acyltransferase [Chloroflexota bacterium]
MLAEFWRVLRKDLRFSVIGETFFLWIANHLPRFYTFDAFRALVLQLAGFKITYPAHIWAPVELRPIGAAGNVSIGRDTFINSRVRFAAHEPAKITIGERVFVGPDCSFETVNHALKLDQTGKRPIRPRSIVIEDDVWLGARVTVLPGVTLGRGSAAAAGAVITSDVQPHTLVGGVPARKIRSLET